MSPPKPVAFWAANYFASVESANCTSCGTCVERCQVNAVRIDEKAGVAKINLDRCIGCGLCVSTCATGAMTLERKPKTEQPAIPKSILHNAFSMWHARDQMYIPGLIKMGIKSKMDRLLALGRL